MLGFIFIVATVILSGVIMIFVSTGQKKKKNIPPKKTEEIEVTMQYEEEEF